MMPRVIKQQWLWIVYAVFAVVAVVTHEGEPRFLAEGPYGAGKYLVWATFLVFLGYSVYCSTKASFIKSLPKLNRLVWARQIGFDLYISVFLSLFLIFLHSGSLGVMLWWAIPVLIYANLAILLYIALNYGSIVALLVG